MKEGRRRLEHAIGADERPTPARARALTGLADLSLDDGDSATARLRFGEAFVLHREHGDRWWGAYSLLGLGLAMGTDGDWAEALPSFEESVELFEQLGDEHWALQAVRRVGRVYEHTGDLRARGRSTNRRSAAHARSGDAFVEARALGIVAQFDIDDGRLDEAIRSLMQSHRIHRDRRTSPDAYWDATAVARIASIAELKGIFWPR